MRIAVFFLVPTVFLSNELGGLGGLFLLSLFFLLLSSPLLFVITQLSQSNMNLNGNPVPVLEFDPVPFDEATAMFTDEEKYKYVRCIRHYWYHTHVEGIPDDDAGMRELCRCDLQKWQRLKGMIFDNDKFFYLEAGKWHQKRARDQYKKKQHDLMKKQAQTMGARLATGSVTIPVTEPTGAVLIFKQNALARVEKRLDVLRGQFPLKDGSKLRIEYDDLKTERRELMRLLNLKA